MRSYWLVGIGVSVQDDEKVLEINSVMTAQHWECS